MTDYSDHPIVAAAKKYSRPGEDLAGRTVGGFVNLDPDARVRALHQLDALMTSDDGASLKQKSRLINMQRELAATHRLMRKANR
ncbi:hypothetical protein [Rhodoplanes sp. Z2-YC6860]|uniref:hypothetical protein n=1 Tax=Rhodoplanes sp. Z2-YC6860 TaxID=674703 RepID=UPI0008323808|nr:hypothetical protein [Rhodoplanes sp. Z2-YC6860]